MESEPEETVQVMLNPPNTDLLVAAQRRDPGSACWADPLCHSHRLPRVSRKPLRAGRVARAAPQLAPGGLPSSPRGGSCCLTTYIPLPNAHAELTDPCLSGRSEMPTPLSSPVRLPHGRASQQGLVGREGRHFFFLFLAF